MLMNDYFPGDFALLQMQVPQNTKALQIVLSKGESPNIPLLTPTNKSVGTIDSTSLKLT